MLVRETEKKQRKLEKVERDQILLEGGNPDEVFLKRQRIEMFKKTKAAFTKKQRERQLQIVSQLLKESRMQKRLETKFSKSHWHNREQAPHPSKRNLHLQKKRKVTMLHVGSGAVDTEEEAPANGRKDGEESAGKPGEGEKNKEVHFDSSDEESRFDDHLQETKSTAKIASEENLAEPEIQGLWERKRRMVTLSGGGEGGGEKGQEGGKVESKAEREMKESAMEKLRKSVVVKQVAAGREFKVSGKVVFCLSINSHSEEIASKKYVPTAQSMFEHELCAVYTVCSLDVNKSCQFCECSCQIWHRQSLMNIRNCRNSFGREELLKDENCLRSDKIGNFWVYCRLQQLVTSAIAQ